MHRWHDSSPLDFWKFPEDREELHLCNTVNQSKVWVKLKTHAAGGITDKDFALARKIEEVALWRPEAGEPAEEHSEQVVHIEEMM